MTEDGLAQTLAQRLQALEAAEARLETQLKADEALRQKLADRLAELEQSLARAEADRTALAAQRDEATAAAERLVAEARALHEQELDEVRTRYEDELESERTARRAAEAALMVLREEQDQLQAEREELAQQVTRLKRERIGLLEEIEAVAAASPAADAP